MVPKSLGLLLAKFEDLPIALKNMAKTHGFILELFCCNCNSYNKKLIF